MKILLAAPRKEVTAWTVRTYLSATIVLIYLSARTIYFTLQNAEEAVDSSIKTSLLFAAYLLAAMQIALHIRTLDRTLLRLWPYILLVGMVFLTAPFGAFGVALLRGGHAIGLLLVTTSAVIGFHNNHRAFLRLLFWFSFLCLVASILIVETNPLRGYVDIASGNFRWVGVTGHPNGLGEVAMICAWTLLSLLHRQRFTLLRVIAALAPLSVTLICLVFSDSRSSQLAVLVMFLIFAVLWGRRIELSLVVGRISVMFFFGVLLLAALASGNVNDRVFRTRSGASDMLSGRPVIWKKGLDTILHHPFGISFDDLTSFWASRQSAGLDLNDQFTHFHNGFIDVIAKGGVVAGVFLLVMLAVNFRDIVRVIMADYSHFVGALAFFVTMIFYNFEESGFMREITVWPVQIFEWAMLPAVLIGQANVRKRRRNPALTRTVLISAES